MCGCSNAFKANLFCALGSNVSTCGAVIVNCLNKEPERAKVAVAHAVAHAVAEDGCLHFHVCSS